jgi:hypothetical protein
MNLEVIEWMLEEITKEIKKIRTAKVEAAPGAVFALKILP